MTQVQGSPFAAHSWPTAVAIDPSGRFAYVTNYDSNDVSAYSINTSSGALTQVPGSGRGPLLMAIDPAGFAYVTNQGPGTVSAYTINADTGALKKVSGSPFKAGISSFGVAIW